jgi:hypothetical protein
MVIAKQVTENYRLILAYAALRPGDDATARGRTLLFASLASLTGRQFAERDIAFGSRGRPYVVGGPDFSIAHCQGLVLAVVAREGRVGVDAEPTMRAMGRVLRKVCDAEELQLAESEGATWVWVGKEAAIKCLGLSALMAGQARLSRQYAVVRNQVLHIRRPLLADGFRVAIASSEHIADNEILICQPPQP